MKTHSAAIAIMLISFLAAILYADAYAASAQSRTRNPLSPKGIETIPLENRAVLFERVQAYIRAGRKHDWAAQYDLMTPEMQRSETRDAFVARQRRASKDGTLDQLVDFEPTNVRPNPEGSAQSWELTGCALYHHQYNMLGNESYFSTIDADLRNGEWHVGVTGPVIHGTDGPLDSCTFHKKRGILAKK